MTTCTKCNTGQDFMSIKSYLSATGEETTLLSAFTCGRVVKGEDTELAACGDGHEKAAKAFKTAAPTIFTPKTESTTE